MKTKNEETPAPSKENQRFNGGITSMTMQFGGIYFTEIEVMQLRQSAQELMENTEWYLNELRKLDQKTLETLKIIFGDRE